MQVVASLLLKMPATPLDLRTLEEAFPHQSPSFLYDLLLALKDLGVGTRKPAMYMLATSLDTDPSLKRICSSKHALAVGMMKETLNEWSKAHPELFPQHAAVSDAEEYAEESDAEEYAEESVAVESDAVEDADAEEDAEDDDDDDADGDDGEIVVIGDGEIVVIGDDDDDDDDADGDDDDDDDDDIVVIGTEC